MSSIGSTKSHFTTTSDGFFKCKKCGAHLRGMGAMKYHIEKNVCARGNGRMRNMKKAAAPFGCLKEDDTDEFEEEEWINEFNRESIESKKLIESESLDNENTNRKFSYEDLKPEVLKKYDATLYHNDGQEFRCCSEWPATHAFLNSGGKVRSMGWCPRAINEDNEDNKDLLAIATSDAKACHYFSGFSPPVGGEIQIWEINHDAKQEDIELLFNSKEASKACKPNKKKSTNVVDVGDDEEEDEGKPKPVTKKKKTTTKKPSAGTTAKKKVAPSTIKKKKIVSVKTKTKTKTKTPPPTPGPKAAKSTPKTQKKKQSNNLLNYFKKKSDAKDDKNEEQAIVEEKPNKKVTPPKAHTRGKAIVGEKIHVIWKDDGQPEWFKGVIRNYNPSTKKHFIIYEDGDKTWHDLSREEYKMIDYKPPVEKKDSKKRGPTSAPKPPTKRQKTQKQSKSVVDEEDSSDDDDQPSSKTKGSKASSKVATPSTPSSDESDFSSTSESEDDGEESAFEPDSESEDSGFEADATIEETMAEENAMEKSVEEPKDSMTLDEMNESDDDDDESEIEIKKKTTSKKRKNPSKMTSFASLDPKMADEESRPEDASDASGYGRHQTPDIISRVEAPEFAKLRYTIEFEDIFPIQLSWRPVPTPNSAGILAVIFSDGKLEVYRLPKPDQIEGSEDGPLSIKIKSEQTIIQRSGFMCLNWSPSGDMLGVGRNDGIAYVFKSILPTKDCPSFQLGPFTSLRPIAFMAEAPSRVGIQSLDFCSNDENSLIVTNGSSDVVAFNLIGNPIPEFSFTVPVTIGMKAFWTYDGQRIVLGENTRMAVAKRQDDLDKQTLSPTDPFRRLTSCEHIRDQYGNHDIVIAGFQIGDILAMHTELMDAKRRVTRLLGRWSLPLSNIAPDHTVFIGSGLHSPNIPDFRYDAGAEFVENLQLTTPKDFPIRSYNSKQTDLTSQLMGDSRVEVSALAMNKNRGHGCCMAAANGDGIVVLSQLCSLHREHLIRLSTRRAKTHAMRKLRQPKPAAAEVLCNDESKEN
eukprot:TRINITY_DN6465_c0_g1_i1.p1 TRINITY_DN6465_c0_g1~~TRINITY_DN6465_c0_g1_i1.p1  ORF type:complete len:1028 (-),score=345.74 TRINITY_DN6465_c0_g1_i1:268-3351(-)